MTTVPAWPDDPATPLDDEEARLLHACYVTGPGHGPAVRVHAPRTRLGRRPEDG